MVDDPDPDDDECPVCLGSYSIDTCLPCGHLFCARCIIDWSERGVVTCPLCRHPFDADDAAAGCYLVQGVELQGKR